MKPGKGAAFVRTKLKNCIQGSVVEKTFRAGESLNSADVQKRESQYTYVDGSDVRTSFSKLLDRSCLLNFQLGYWVPDKMQMEFRILEWEVDIHVIEDLPLCVSPNAVCIHGS